MEAPVRISLIRILAWVSLVRVLIRIGLVGIQAVASIIRTPVGRDHGQGSLQGEVQHGFRRQPDLLAFGGCLHAPAQPSAGSRTDGSSFASARDGANDGSDAGSGADLLRCSCPAKSPCENTDRSGCCSTCRPQKCDPAAEPPATVPRTYLRSSPLRDGPQRHSRRELRCRRRPPAANRAWHGKSGPAGWFRNQWHQPTAPPELSLKES